MQTTVANVVGMTGTAMAAAGICYFVCTLDEKRWKNDLANREAKHRYREAKLTLLTTLVNNNNKNNQQQQLNPSQSGEQQEISISST